MAFDKKGWIVDRAAAMFKRQDQYAAKVKHLYDNAVERLLALAAQTDIPIDGDPFSFSDNPRISQEATAIIRQLYSQVYQQIKMGVEAEWDQANEFNDKLIKYIFGSKAKKNNLAQWFERNRQAQDAFFARSQAVGGMNLSQRVWKYTSSLRPELETAISVSVGEGVSASTMSRRVRQYLREPDKLFRRVRGSDGKLRLSKPAQLYHSGRGVYRSSYKNAMRLTRTETNAAYRTADEERWRNLPFVVGYEVKTSNNHPEPDICDDLKGKYPKDFKYTAWHPQCRCYVVPILCTPQEMADLQKKVIAGEDVSRWRSKIQVDVPPQGFVNWVRDNQDRIEAAATKPYFIANNKGLVVKIWNGEPLAPEPPEAKLAQQGKKMLTDARAAMRGLQSDALDNRFTALESAISSGADPAEVMRLYERVLQGAATQRKWDAQVWAGFTAEQKANLQELEKLLGIRKGRPMTHAQADEGRTNPLYNNPANKGKRYYKVTKSGRLVKNPAWDDQYSVNCQTTVPTYLLRRWGFNVEALGNKKGDVWKKLGGGYTNVWKNKKGEIGFGLRFQETTTRTVNMFDWLSQQPDGIYQVQCTWKGGKSGHTWCYVKENGKGFMYDPQNNKMFKNMAEFKEYSQNVSPKYGYHYFRIDDLRINNGAMSKMVQQYTERIDPVEAARIKRHATRDEGAIKQAWRNRLRDNLSKEITAEAMKSDAVRARLKAFENAVKADDAAAIRREYYRAKQGLQVQKQWTEQRKALAAIENEANTIKTKVAGYKEVDTTKLDNLMRYRLHKAEAEINKLKLQNAAIEMTKKDIEDLIPDADKWLKQFTSAELKQAHSAIERTFNRWTWDLDSEASLQFLQGRLKREIAVVQSSPYKTKAVAEEAFKRRLAVVERRIDIKTIQNDIAAELQFAKTTRSQIVKDLANEIDALVKDDKADIFIIKQKASDFKDKVKKLMSRKAKASVSGAMSDDQIKDAMVDLFQKNGRYLSRNDVVVKDGCVMLTQSQHMALADMCDITAAEHRQTFSHSRGGYCRTSNSFTINGCLRDVKGKGKNMILGKIDNHPNIKLAADMYGDKLQPDDIKTIKVLDTVIQRNSLPFPIKVVRNVDFNGINPFFNGQLAGGLPVDVTNQILALASKDMKPDAGFMSVSTDATMNVFKHRRFQLQIEIPQGSPIYVTKNGGESECVLARAAKMKFKGVEYDSSRTICIVKCVLE